MKYVILDIDTQKNIYILKILVALIVIFNSFENLFNFGSVSLRICLGLLNQRLTFHP